MLSRADVNDNVKSILEFTFKNSFLLHVHLTLETITESQFCVSVCCDGFRKSVSGRIHSSVSVPHVLHFSFISLSCSLPLSPSFRLSLSFRLFPSFLPPPSCNNTFVGRLTQKESSLPAVTVRILCSYDLARMCIRANYLSLVQDLPWSNMLEAAISVSPFRSTSQTRLCVLRMSRYVAFIIFTVSYPGHSLGGSYPSAEVQLMYPTAPADSTMFNLGCYIVLKHCFHRRYPSFHCYSLFGPMLLWRKS